MTQHKLKIRPFYYQAVAEGQKTFEVRLNDRNFQPGDTVILREFEDGCYTSSRKLVFKIGFVLSLNDFLSGISCIDGEYVVFSLIEETVL